MTSYEDYQPALERMAQTGEQGLLTKEKVGFFARTSGTTGVTKRIPVVASSYLPYLRCEAIFVYLGMRVIERSNMRRGLGPEHRGNSCFPHTWRDSGGLYQRLCSRWSEGLALQYLLHAQGGLRLRR